MNLISVLFTSYPQELRQLGPLMIGLFIHVKGRLIKSAEEVKLAGEAD